MRKGAGIRQPASERCQTWVDTFYLLTAGKNFSSPQTLNTSLQTYSTFSHPQNPKQHVPGTPYCSRHSPIFLFGPRIRYIYSVRNRRAGRH